MTTTQRNRRLGMGLGLLIALAVVLWLIFGGHRYVTTENAYIKIDMISLTADVSGPLVAVNVERNQPVQRVVDFNGIGRRQAKRRLTFRAGHAKRAYGRRLAPGMAPNLTQEFHC